MYSINILLCLNPTPPIKTIEYDLLPADVHSMENKSAKQQEMANRKSIKIEWEYVRNAKMKVSVNNSHRSIIFT